MTEAEAKRARLVAMGISLAACFVAYKFVPNAMVKTAAVSVGGVIAAKKLPYLSVALA